MGRRHCISGCGDSRCGIRREILRQGARGAVQAGSADAGAGAASVPVLLFALVPDSADDHRVAHNLEQHHAAVFPKGTISSRERPLLSRCGADGVPTFVEAGAPTDEQLHALLQTSIAGLMKMLTRRGVRVEDLGQAYLAEPDADGEEARTLRPLQAAAITYRIACGPRAEQKVLTLRGATPRETAAQQPLCADIDGFSVHAAVRVEAHDRKRLEQLCRHITRPAWSYERVQLNAAGQVEIELKTAWRNGTTHLVMSPLEFMQRLAALVPRPRLHLIRFHGWTGPSGPSQVDPGGTPRAFETTMPNGRAINPISRTNWEGTGIEPGVAVSADDALRVAQLRALPAIGDKTNDRAMRDAISARIAELEKGP